MASEKQHRIEWYAGAIVFVAFIAAHLVLGAKAAVKVLGSACIATGILWLLRRSIPVGIEGRAPAFYLGGWRAVLAGFAMLAVGVVLLIYSSAVACMLGWDETC